MVQDLLHRRGGSPVCREKTLATLNTISRWVYTSVQAHHTGGLTCPHAAPGGQTELPLRTQTWELDC